MSGGQVRHWTREGAARLLVWMAAHSSRNVTLLDRVCRAFVSRWSRQPAGADFMRDDFVDNDRGFDPDELDRYQRGEGSQHLS